MIRRIFTTIAAAATLGVIYATALPGDWQGHATVALILVTVLGALVGWFARI